ncbi:hypothetical protein ES703_87052 [subsurface metagenome]
MQDRVTKEKIKKYITITSKAIKIAESSVVKGKEKEAREIIKMVSNYLSDSKYFEKNKDFVNAFAALSYAHGWLDAGVRLDIFDIKNDKFFTVK